MDSNCPELHFQLCCHRVSRQFAEQGVTTTCQRLDTKARVSARRHVFFSLRQCVGHSNYLTTSVETFLTCQLIIGLRHDLLALLNAGALALLGFPSWITKFPPDGHLCAVLLRHDEPNDTDCLSRSYIGCSKPQIKPVVRRLPTIRSKTA